MILKLITSSFLGLALWGVIVPQYFLLLNRVLTSPEIMLKQHTKVDFFSLFLFYKKKKKKKKTASITETFEKDVREIILL